jgi:hypothetical protein
LRVVLDLIFVVAKKNIFMTFFTKSNFGINVSLRLFQV